MKVGDLVKLVSPYSPPCPFNPQSGVVTAQSNSIFGTVVYWFQDNQYTDEMRENLVVISESR